MKSTPGRRERKGDWVLAGGAPGESAHCTRCGEGLRLSTPLRIEIFLAASKAFVKCHSRCRPGKFAEPTPRSPEEWARSRDTGISSATIYQAISGNRSPYDHFDIPHDAGDFGRCYRLLKLFPAWRSELHQVAVYPKWKPFVESWDELKRLYETDDAALDERIRELKAVAA
jgi:hypothetical protein